MLSPTLDTIRLFLHLIAAAIWVGGQFALAGMLPGLRKAGPEATQAAANGFARVGWPAFIVALVTGIWSILSIEGSSTTAFQITLGLKLLIVVVAGFSAAAHSASSNKAVIAITGALGAISGLGMIFLGVLLSTGGS